MADQPGWRFRAGTLFETEKQSASGSRGVVAANNPIGSAAGAEILAIGGNAIDAAIAALFTLNVVEPQMVGLFGAGWINIRLADGATVILDNYAMRPLLLPPTYTGPSPTPGPITCKPRAGRTKSATFRSAFPAP